MGSHLQRQARFRYRRKIGAELFASSGDLPLRHDLSFPVQKTIWLILSPRSIPYAVALLVDCLRLLWAQSGPARTSGSLRCQSASAAAARPTSSPLQLALAGHWSAPVVCGYFSRCACYPSSWSVPPIRVALSALIIASLTAILDQETDLLIPSAIGGSNQSAA